MNGGQCYLYTLNILSDNSLNDGQAWDVTNVFDRHVRGVSVRWVSIITIIIIIIVIIVITIVYTARATTKTTTVLCVYNILYKWARVVSGTRAPGLPKPYPIVYVYFYWVLWKLLFHLPLRPNNTKNPLENYATRRIRRRRRDHVQPITLFFGNVSHRLQKTFRTMCSWKCVPMFLPIFFTF